MNRQRWQDWVTFVLGLWTIASPFLFFIPGTAGSPAPAVSGAMDWSFYASSIVQWNFYIVGLALAVVGIVALYSHRLWEEWIDVILGVWLLISPWALRYTTQSILTWDAVITGLVIAVLAVWTLTSGRRERRPA